MIRRLLGNALGKDLTEFSKRGMIAANFEVEMLKRYWRLMSGTVLAIVTVGVISHQLNDNMEELSKKADLFLFLSVWALTTGATLGVLIYDDLRKSLHSPKSALTPDEIHDHKPRSQNNV